MPRRGSQTDLPDFSCFSLLNRTEYCADLIAYLHRPMKLQVASFLIPLQRLPKMARVKIHCNSRGNSACKSTTAEPDADRDENGRNCRKFVGK
jgi:hypothetical protein